VAVGWCFQDQADPSTEAALAALSEGAALVPAIWPLEIVNVLLVAERRRRLSRAETERFLELLGALPITVEEVPLRVAASHAAARAREHGLSAYDAAYLDLAARKGIPLATRDAALKAACRKAGVPLLRR
jgi:predicted nucleic acid-binding protein